MSITPRSFDPHKDAIEGRAEIWADPEISRADIRENRPWVRDHIARTYSVPVPLTTTPLPIVSPELGAAESRWDKVGLVVATVALVVVAALLVLAWVVFR